MVTFIFKEPIQEILKRIGTPAKDISELLDKAGYESDGARTRKAEARYETLTNKYDGSVQVMVRKETAEAENSYGYATLAALCDRNHGKETLAVFFPPQAYHPEFRAESEELAARMDPIAGIKMALLSAPRRVMDIEEETGHATFLSAEERNARQCGTALKK